MRIKSCDAANLPCDRLANHRLLQIAKVWIMRASWLDATPRPLAKSHRNQSLSACENS